VRALLKERSWKKSEMIKTISGYPGFAEGGLFSFLLTILSFNFISVAPAFSQDWPQLQHDPRRTGRTTVSVVPGYTAKWVWVDEDHLTANFVSQVNASIDYPDNRTVILGGDVQPVVAEDRVFFGAVNGEFYALNAVDGTTAWKKQLGGAVLHTAAYSSGTVVSGCMDGRIYAWNAADGTDKWTYTAQAGFNVAVLIVDNSVYMGSRDGNFYAVDLETGQLKWKYRTVTETPEHPHSGAPIMQSAASDGSLIFFGAENMYFYALNAATGTEVWRRKLVGQSFQYSWPVVHNNMVLSFTTFCDGHSEWLIEEELDALPDRNGGESRTDYASRVWPQEREMIRNWLAQNPTRENFFAMKSADGNDAFAQKVPMGQVGGIGYPNRSPVVDNSDRILIYWRTKSTTMITGGTYGTKYTPDISVLDQTSGDRGWMTVDAGFNCELDNTFMMTIGGDYLYLNNHMRGSHCINLTNGNTVRMTSIQAIWDGANFRNWGNRLIWFGNDNAATSMPPPSAYRSPQGDCGIVLAMVNGTPTMFIQESGHYQNNFGCIAAVESQ
jgi:outer membrane protein assembly factor BamB